SLSSIDEQGPLGHPTKRVSPVCPFFLFFLQAEDGIRDWSVTGVQTCALPILGDPAVLPELIEFYMVNDVDIQGTAHWAVKRIASRRPEASLDAIRKVAPAAGADRRCSLAMALGAIPEQPGRRDALLSL